MIALIIIAVVVLIILLLFLRFVYKNMKQDDALMKRVNKSGYDEKQEILPNKTVINYAEGGLIGDVPLLLLHGQGQSWEDYDKVLPELAKSFHVFALDCHGHGESSHFPERYKCSHMTEDFIWFINNVIKRPCIVSGHSSGGILAAAIAAKEHKNVAGVILEDPPFFKVQPEEMQNTFVWLDAFKIMHDFKNQIEESNYYAYYFKHSVIWSMFKGFKDKIIKSARKYTLKHPGEPLKIWYLPQSVLRGEYYKNTYDQKFGETFYDGSWLEGISQEKILQSIECPCIYLKARTGYLGEKGVVYDYTDEIRRNNILCCANDDEDAKRVTELVKGSRMIVTKTNDHLIHYKYPEVFVNACREIKQEI